MPTIAAEAQITMHQRALALRLLRKEPVEQEWMEFPQEERGIAAMLSPEFDMSQCRSRGASSSYDHEVGRDETLKQAADLKKSRYTKQQEDKEKKNNSTGTPQQRAYNPLAKVDPLAASCSEPEPEERATNREASGMVYPKW